MLSHQTPEYFRFLYDMFKDNPKVKWKGSVKSILNLPPEEGVC